MTLQHALRGRTRYPGIINENVLAFSPLSISSLAAWYQANKEKRLAQIELYQTTLL